MKTTRDDYHDFISIQQGMQVAVAARNPDKSALKTLQNSTFSAFLVGQQAAKSMLAKPLPENGQRGTIIFTNASAAFKGYPKSGAFAMV